MTAPEPLDGRNAPTRVALLHCGHQHHPRVAQLVNDFAGETIDIELDDSGNPADTMLPQLVGCDLILFEAFGPMSPEQNATLISIRTTSTAPLVLLIGSARPDRTINGILAGADAVMPFNTATDVFVAHCRALVRRWRSMCSATPAIA